MSVAKLAGVGLAVAALSACGSSHRLGLHDYSVQQVERVFAAQLIPLRQARHGPETGVVKLLDHNVVVDVVLNGADAASCQACDFRRLGGLSWKLLGNVAVFYPYNQMRAVKAALRSLQA